MIWTARPVAASGATHEGTRTRPPEEVEVVAALVSRLLSAGWVNATAFGRQFGSTTSWSSRRTTHRSLPSAIACLGARVGTVDRFQGQEAPIVIYRWRRLSGGRAEWDGIPLQPQSAERRDFESAVRSRPRGQPRLFAPDCRSPRQMKLANALCRFRELSIEATLAAPGLVALSS